MNIGTFTDWKMKPMMIIPPGLVTDQNLKLMRDNGICVIVAKDPSKVRFIDTIPDATSRTKIENAAIKFSRIMLARQWGHITTSGQIGISEISRVFVECLIEGTPLDQAGTREEQEKVLFDQAKRSEITRLAQEEARTERAAEKKRKLEESKSKIEPQDHAAEK